ncbi:MAG: hypothetical protein JWQ56_1923 [Pseudarthrobacter sp.]|nr:hypothetical protein [Pseudarthrobacter sp.]
MNHGPATWTLKLGPAFTAGIAASAALTDLTLLAYSAEPVHDALNLLATWAATIRNESSQVAAQRKEEAPRPY